MLITILLTTVLILSIIINVLLYIALSNQLNRVHLYENLMTEYENWNDVVRDIVKNTYIKMKKIDDKELFFKDDDVGFVFSELLDLLKKLNDRVEK